MVEGAAPVRISEGLLGLEPVRQNGEGLESTYDPARFHLLHGGFNESEVRAHQRLLKSSAGHNFPSASRVSIFSRTGSEAPGGPPHGCDVAQSLRRRTRKTPPRAGRSGSGEYSKLHWRTMPQDTCANEPVNATDPQVEPLPAAIRKSEDEFIVSNTAGGG